MGQNSTGNEYPENVCQSCGYSVLSQSVNWNVVPAPSEWMTGMIGMEGRAWPLLSAVISGSSQLVIWSVKILARVRPERRRFST